MKTTSNATQVTLQNISKAFGKTQVLQDIDLVIAPGELFFLLGPSGCGKTTLLRIVAGFTEATRGAVLFDDRLLTQVPPHKRNTGMVFQNYALWPHMTVAQNVAFGLDIRGTSKKDKAERVGRALELVHLPGYQERFPHQLSGGQQQRVALARALVIEPDVVLLDEPLSNLDAGLRIEMRKEIHRIHNDLGITMIYVTHDQKEALSLATRMAVMYKGVLAQVDTPTEIYQNPTSAFIAQFVGETNIIPGTITDISSDTLTVKTDAGILTCPTSRAAINIKKNMSVSVSIRPEGLSPSPLSGEQNYWHTRVVESTYLGEVVQTVLRAGEKTLRQTILNPAMQPPSAGTDMDIYVNPAHIRILAAQETEQ